MQIHIGNIIHAIIKQRGISVSSFANLINCSPRNVYQIFKKHHIDTELLTIISLKLEENLFLNYLSENDLMSYQHANYSKELLSKISNKEELLVNIDLIHRTQDPLTIKLTDMIILLQEELNQLKRKNQ